MAELLPPGPDGDTWVLPANENALNRVVRRHSVLAALLECLDANPKGASLAMCQAAVDARQLKREHLVRPLMVWAARERGIGFECRDGKVFRA